MHDLDTLTELSLFSGTCAFTLGLRLAGVRARTVCYVENEPFCQRLIEARIRDGYLDDAPLWDDVKTFDGHPWAGRVDIITAGFPCQGWSAAGRHLGASDPRNLWPETARIIGETRPMLALLENSPRILPYVFGTIQPELRALGYDCSPPILASALAAGANHIRERWWTVTHSSSLHVWEQRRRSAGKEGESPLLVERIGTAGNADSDSDSQRFTRWSSLSSATRESGVIHAQGDRRWAFEPRVCGVSFGTPQRVERLRALGNGIVPAVVAKFLREA